MTTYIVDDKSAACDSMWSYSDGTKCTDVPIQKYLFIDEPIEDVALEPSLVVYSGDYEQLVLHQAFLLEMLTLDQYQVAVNNYKKLGRSALSYVIINLAEWNVDPFNTRQDLGLLFEGSGGKHAFSHYRDNYCVKLAVGHAIERDPKSDHDVNYLYRALSGELQLEHFAPLNVDMYNKIYEHTLDLHMAIQSQEMGVDMSQLKFAGCSTAPSVEAQDFCTDQLIENESKRLNELKEKKKAVGENVVAIRQKKFAKKVIDKSAFNHSLT
ncbi:TPA: hypothetical protein ACHCBX_001702 [Vibrio parahaemolyticus]|uniref:hypothetical protein n=1 Tax=Vibrio TaxID=662 RepID=UPI0005B6FB3C|nr:MULTISPECIES: hypothetical protein [Vibrio]EGQ7777255.1 hypothetical protein [Vibrio parahaemolyticus]EGQ8397493.1 hypothetical protein [Vibrio parahaemolyticus]EGQ9048721.1 hypothetical protein [Vibrio parahaemolyticus]EGQ9147492.1 hypothetical protein [Vibrio parahaemolyticus]EGQ9587672.1 hypothetical protein [Vibrio parahaemolyticus]